MIGNILRALNNVIIGRSIWIAMFVFCILYGSKMPFLFPMHKILQGVEKKNMCFAKRIRPVI